MLVLGAGSLFRVNGQMWISFFMIQCCKLFIQLVYSKDNSLHGSLYIKRCRDEELLGERKLNGGTLAPWVQLGCAERGRIWIVRF